MIDESNSFWPHLKWRSIKFKCTQNESDNRKTTRDSTMLDIINNNVAVDRPANRTNRPTDRAFKFKVINNVKIEQTIKEQRNDCVPNIAISWPKHRPRTLNTLFALPAVYKTQNTKYKTQTGNPIFNDGHEYECPATTLQLVALSSVTHFVSFHKLDEEVYKPSILL